MKRIAMFSIPAHGHTNPMLPVAEELVRRGCEVRFYSFDEFGEKIRATGADFVSCDAYLPRLSAGEEASLKRVNTTAMAVQDIRVTLAMNDFLEGEFKSFRPDLVYTDSVCFWGKLNAWKFERPMVVSTSTFAFNQMSSRYMKQSGRELADMILGLPRISRELKKLKAYGYKVNNALDLVQSGSETDSVVYTSRDFQPYANCFSGHYAFVGPSVLTDRLPDKEKARPLVYISLGTVINDRPEFYRNCMDALRDLPLDVVISCGNAIDRDALGELPENVSVFPYVDQLEVLARADVFLTHCGMNSVSESLYMATPLVLYPQTGEQRAVARRAAETGAGQLLTDDSAAGIRSAVQEVLKNESYAQAARRRSEDFRACGGAKSAADFILSAPHEGGGFDMMKTLNAANLRFHACYWLVAAALILLFGALVSWKYVWIAGMLAGTLNYPLGQAAQERAYRRLAAKNKI